MAVNKVIYNNGTEPLIDLTGDDLTNDTSKVENGLKYHGKDGVQYIGTGSGGGGGIPSEIPANMAVVMICQHHDPSEERYAESFDFVAINSENETFTADETSTPVVFLTEKNKPITVEISQGGYYTADYRVMIYKDGVEIGSQDIWSSTANVNIVKDFIMIETDYHNDGRYVDSGWYDKAYANVITTFNVR